MAEKKSEESLKEAPRGFGLIEDIKLWEREWQGMPEFVQDNLTAFRSILVHFANQEAIDDFTKLIKQNITDKTPSLWFPKAEILKCADKRYADEQS